MSGFRNLFALGGECPPSGWTSPPNPRQSSTKNNNLSWAEVDRGNDASAPNVAGSFGRARGEMHLDLPQEENPFTFGGSVTHQPPPAGVPPHWGDLREAITAHPQSGIPRTVAQGPPQTQAAQGVPTAQYTRAWPPPSRNGALGTLPRKVWNCADNKGLQAREPKLHSSRTL